jgi:integrase/recombinase XerC
MVEQFLQYLKSNQNYSEHTLIAYRNDLIQANEFYKKTFELELGGKLEGKMIRGFVVDLMERGVSSTSIHRKISAQKSFFKHLLRIGVVTKNPTIGITLPKKRKSLPKFVGKADMEFILDAERFTNDFFGQRDKAILECFYFTGIRRAELLNLKETDFDVYQGTLRVLGKRAKERLVPLTSGFNKSLQNYLEAKRSSEKGVSEYLFCTNSEKKMYPKFVYNLVNKYLSTSKTSKKSPHVLRHTFATHMLNNGADLNSIKELLGHESLVTTQVYTHNTIDKLKNIYKQAHPKGE